MEINGHAIDHIIYQILFSFKKTQAQYYLTLSLQFFVAFPKNVSTIAQTIATRSVMKAQADTDDDASTRGSRRGVKKAFTDHNHICKDHLRITFFPAHATCVFRRIFRTINTLLGARAPWEHAYRIRTKPTRYWMRTGNRFVGLPPRNAKVRGNKRGREGG